MQAARIHERFHFAWCSLTDAGGVKVEPLALFSQDSLVQTDTMMLDAGAEVRHGCAGSDVQAAPIWQMTDALVAFVALP